RAAESLGLPIQQHVDNIVDNFKQAFASLGIEYDQWMRTTDPHHESAVQNFWRLMDERGYIYKGRYDGWFCGNCNEFKEVDANEESPLCPIHERPLDRVAEESYFFKLSAFQQPLLELYDSRPDFVQPETRLNEVRSFVSGGLKDLSISRISVKWGIPVPGDPGHTIYVWLDALLNYITALGWGNEYYKGFQKYWPAVHLVGKDILRFHAVYWPAFLMACGIELPKSVRVQGMLLMGGRKMSKTLGNVVRVNELVPRFTPDMVRYFLLREVAFGQDGYFSYEALIDRINSDLADGLGNLTSRTLTMVRNYFEGVPPRAFETEDEDRAEVRVAIVRAKEKFDEEFDQFNFSLALEGVWSGIARVDKYITDRQPWKLAKDPEGRNELRDVISTAYEGLRHLVLLVAPVLPQTSRVIWRQLGFSGDPLAMNPRSVAWGESIDVQRIGEISPAFPKLDKEKMMAAIEREGGAADAANLDAAKPDAAKVDGVKPDAAAKPENQSTAGSGSSAQAASGVITIDDFVKVELRVATVLEAERIPKADKLLRLIVDV